MHVIIKLLLSSIIDAWYPRARDAAADGRPIHRLQAKTAWFGGIRRHLRIHPGADGCLEYDSIRLLFVILVIV